MKLLFITISYKKKKKKIRKLFLVHKFLNMSFKNKNGTHNEKLFSFRTSLLNDQKPKQYLFFILNN